MKFCCEKFAEESANVQAASDGTFVYASRHRAIEPDDDGETWNVNGCCGGCFVLTEMRYCPFCGSKLEFPKPNI